ncbi:alpha/beta fold hydrolase [Minwuia thermotolerans]|uniref:Alpha/beta hydrolase n=1 Tax=Minwuia thermotolerans TaxID=2056226 RepID=A0A2M9G1F4_9PROT|nr:alpha/beta fold hydrolase [Minwuia thermotolerans]PJK29541.1 alpha/beta hydrolase [Minwuia thermotolerans]
MSRANVVLVPGLLCTERLWRDQVAALEPAADIVIPRHDLDDNMAAIARRVLDAAPERFAIAGLSMGGYIAFEIWRQAPERVERLALLDTRASGDTAEETQRRKDLLELAHKGRFTGIHERLMPLLIHEDRLKETDLTAAIAGMAEETGRDGFVNQTKAIMARPDSRETCRTVDVPTLVLCGRQDAVTPLAMSEEMAGLIPGAKLEVIEDCGHMSAMERPEAVNAALERWLAA